MRPVRPFLPVVMLLAACGGPSRAPAPVLRPEVPAGSGLVHVYLDAPPATTRWSSVSVAGTGGALLPLVLEPRRDATAGTYHRLLASGAVPVGNYAALVLTRPMQGGEAEDLRVELPFAVTERAGAVLALSTGSNQRLEGKVLPRSATGATGLAACPSGGFVAMFDKRSGRVFGTVPTGRGPSSIALDVERRRAYVALAADDAIAAIDLDEGVVLDRRGLRTGDAPADLALLPDGSTLLVAARGSSTVLFVDARSLAETDRIQVPNAPVSLAVDRNGLRAWVASRDANAVTAIDLASRSIARTVAVDAEPVRVQLDAAQANLWVLHEVAPYLIRIDVRSFETTSRLNLGAGGTAFRIEPRSGRLLVARRDGGGIDVYDPLSLLPVDALPSRGRIGFLATDAETSQLFAAVDDRAGLDAFGLVARAPAWSTDLGCAPAYVAVAGDR